MSAEEDLLDLSLLLGTLRVVADGLPLDGVSLPSLTTLVEEGYVQIQWGQGNERFLVTSAGEQLLGRVEELGA